MKKTIIYALIAVIIGVIFLSINTIFQNEDIESVVEEETNAEEHEDEPSGKKITIELEENMGFSAP